MPSFLLSVLGELRAALDGSWDGELLISHQISALILGEEEETLPAKPAFRGGKMKLFCWETVASTNEQGASCH